MKHPFNASLSIQYKEAGNFCGILSINTTFPLTVESINIEIDTEIRLISIDLLSHSKSLVLGKEEFSFEFSLDGHVEIAYICYATITMDSENYRKLELSQFENMLTYITKENQFIVKKPFEYHRECKEYKVKKQEIELFLNTPAVTIIVALIYIPSYLYILYRYYHFSFNTVILGILGGVFFPTIISAIYSTQKEYSSGIVSARITSYGKNQFECEIVGLHSIHKPKIYYVITKYIASYDEDNKRTLVRNKTLYKTTIKELPSTKTVVFNFPKDKYLARTFNNDVEIHWSIVVEGNKNSLEGKFKVE